MYGYVGVDQVFQVTAAHIPASGFVVYGTVDYGIADFHDLSIESSGGLKVIKPQVKTNSAWRSGKL